jgi:hypothetical protein
VKQAIFVELKTCRDGYRVVQSRPTRQESTFLGKLVEERAAARSFEALSDRWKTRVHELKDLSSLLVVQFINARDEARMLNFVQTYGLPLPGGREPVADCEEQRVHLETVLTAFLDGRPIRGNSRARAFLETNAQRTVVNATLDFRVTSGLRVALRAKSLAQFFLLEGMLAISNSLGCRRCDHCGDLFFVGAAVGRRASRRFCSERCRVAGFRARQSVRRPSSDQLSRNRVGGGPSAK